MYVRFSTQGTRVLLHCCLVQTSSNTDQQQLLICISMHETSTQHIGNPTRMLVSAHASTSSSVCAVVIYMAVVLHCVSYCGDVVTVVLVGASLPSARCAF